MTTAARMICAATRSTRQIDESDVGSHPLPTEKGLAEMPWWVPLGGLVGAIAVIAGLLFVGKVGAGAFAGLTITANILMSLAVDRFGMFGMQVHELTVGRIAGAALWSPASP